MALSLAVAESVNLYNLGRSILENAEPLTSSFKLAFNSSPGNNPTLIKQTKTGQRLCVKIFTEQLFMGWLDGSVS